MISRMIVWTLILLAAVAVAYALGDTWLFLDLHYND
jgi:hypothetical protein